MEAMGGTSVGVGRGLIEAIERRDFDRLETLFAPDVRFRALTPRREPAASTASGARDVVEDWFAGADLIEKLEGSVEEIAGRLHVGYRLRLREEGAWKLVEQHAFATVSDGLIADISVVCSGFRPLPANGEPAARLDAIGEDCATLTPRIRTAIDALRSGEVLEVTADDPAAEEGLRAWSRLTGHELLAVVSTPARSAPSFYLRRR